MTAVSRFFVSFFLASLATLQVTQANEPLLVLKSSSSLRLIQMVEQFGLPDPIEAAGLNTSATLELLQGSINLRSPSGGLVFFDEDRPHMVICMPLEKQGTSIDKLSVFAGGKFSQDASGVYQLDSDADASKFFAIQSGDYLLFGNSREHLKDSADSLRMHPWTSIDDDLRVLGNLQRFTSSQRSVLSTEVLTLLTSAPKTELVLNIDSLLDHLKFGLQQFLIQSILECNSFDLSLNQLPNGDIRAQMNTMETVASSRISSAFQPIDSSSSNLAIHFTSKIAIASVADVVSWAKTKEKVLLEEIGDSNVTDISDLGTSAKLIASLSEVVQQSVSHQKLDGTMSIGKADGKDYLFGAIAVSNGKQLAKKLQSVIDDKQILGMSCRDLRTDPEISEGDVVHAVVDLPKEIEVAGFNLDSTPKLHIELFNNRLSICVGAEAERFSAQSRLLQPSSELRPLSLVYQLDKDRESDSKARHVLPLDFGRLKMSISLTEQGRKYEMFLGKPESPNSDSNRTAVNATE